jgi:enterochelin esterase family protein
MKRLSLIFLACVCAVTLFAAKPVGTLHRDTILGVPCRVYLPSDYADRVKNRKGAFPCLYLQHGMFGCEDDWANHNLIPILDSLLKEEVIIDMVIIMPDNFLGSIPPAERQRLMNAPAVTPDGQPYDTSEGPHHWRKLTREQERAYEQSGYWEEHFDDFIDAVEGKYYLSPRSENRAVAGLSMGGFHSFHLNHYLAGVFDYVGLFSPVILPLNSYANLHDESVNGFNEQLPYKSPAYANWMDEMRGQASLPPSFWVGMGRQDFLYGQLQEFRHWLDANGYEYTYFESTGGHTWVNWQDYLQRFLKTCFIREY